MKNVLLLTDFSNASINAITYAVQLFKGQETTFYVLHTFAPVVMYHAITLNDITVNHKDIAHTFEESTLNKIKKIIDPIASKIYDQKHIFKPVASFNTLLAGIHELTDGCQIECIIMGTKGATGLSEVFIGSETMYVIKNTKIPVIGIPAGYQFVKPRELLFVTDYGIGTKQVGLSLLNDVATFFKGRLVFLNAYQGDALSEKQLSHKNELDTYFQHHAIPTQTPSGMNVLEAIEDYHASHRIDLLVLVHNKHNFFENLLFTPVVRKVVHNSNVPFLILPPPIYKNEQT